MLKSMTGFGRAENVSEGFNIKVSIKSVNHRYIDLAVRLPKYYVFAEEKIRQSAAGYISRGKVEVLVSIEKTEGSDKTVTLDKAVAQNYIDALRELAPLGVEDDIKASTIAAFSDIFKIETEELDEEKVSAMICETFEKAAQNFVDMRSCEGERMAEDIRSHLECLAENLEAVKKRYPKIVDEYRARLENKIRELLGSDSADEARIITEAAIFAEKTDIGEETVRLASHIQEFYSAIEANGPIGKKLDFIVQEMNRETNTMGSKSGDVELTKHIVEMKSEIEKIREQIQNIE